MRLATSLFFSFLLYIGVASGQTTVRVPADYATIQEALDGAEEYDTVLVAPGTYNENLSWPRGKDLHLIGEAGRESTIIDGGGIDQVLDLDDLTDLSLLNGFTIKNGFATSRGGGISGSDCGLELRNLLICDNTTLRDGSGAYLTDFTGDIKSCDFINNSCNGDSQVEGIALFLEPEGDMEIDNCNFIENSAENASVVDGTLSIRGWHNQSLTPLVIIKNCSFLNNSISGRSFGSGIFVEGFFDPLEIRIDSCEFIGNQSLDTVGSTGGTININFDINLHLSNSLFENNNAVSGSCLSYDGFFETKTVIINNCIFKNNKSNSEPGACVFNLDYGVDFLMVNSEISHNQGKSFDGYLYGDTKNLKLINTTIAYNELPISIRNPNLTISQSILWNNGPLEIDESSSFQSDIRVSNSLIKGGFPGTNVIDSDPLFISEEELIPTENSPCLNAGDPSINISDDLLGNPRPMPLGTNPDIGAYEVDQQIESSTNEQATESFKVFPNPVTDWLFFSENIELISVYNNLGQLLKSERYTTAINVKELPEGKYTIILSKDQKEQVETIIVVR